MEEELDEMGFSTFHAVRDAKARNPTVELECPKDTDGVGRRP